MKLNNRTDYSLRVVIFLLDRQDKVKISEIAKFYKIPINHLKVIVNKLSQLEVVNTTTGPQGGIELNEKARNLSLDKLIKSLEDFELVECFNKNTDTCRITKSCRLKSILVEANNSFLNTLKKYNISDL